MSNNDSGKNNPTTLQTTSKKRNSKSIEPIHGSPSSNAPAPVIDVGTTFSPWGAIAKAYATTLAYRLECKRIDAEIERVREQADLIHHMVDAQLKARLEELSHRRIHIERHFDTVQQELKANHIERMKIMEMAQEAQKQAMTDCSQEEKEMWAEMAKNLVAQVREFGTESTKQLDNMVKALPPIPAMVNMLSD